MEELLAAESIESDECKSLSGKCPHKYGDAVKIGNDKTSSEPIWTLKMEEDLQRSMRAEQQEKNLEKTKHYIDGPATATMSVGIPKRNADGTITWEDSPAIVRVGADNLHSHGSGFPRNLSCSGA
jgi:hypothetical protein